jgi:predicted acylesterase/phospholipase RssA
MLWIGSRSSPSRLNLALQGGGAHGAFTWGVLEALLEDSRLCFEGLSGSSAGAMNAVVFADGWMKGGREGARQGLAHFWTEIGKQLPPGDGCPRRRRRHQPVARRQDACELGSVLFSAAALIRLTSARPRLARTSSRLRAIARA